MSDMSGLPRETRCYVQRFYDTGGSWIAWDMPRGISMLSILLLSGGSGGGGGMTGATGTNRGGGGGGGCSAMNRLVIPALFLPNRLYLMVGSGGKGGAATIGGSAGGTSWVSTEVDTGNAFVVMGSNATTGGAPGTTSGGSGTGTLAATFSATRYTTLGNYLSTAGTNGTSGSTGSVSALTPTATIFLTGGGGGGGSTTSNTNGGGGDINAAGLMPAILGGAGNGQPGSHAFTMQRPFTATGGAGGSGSGNGTGGTGGNGGIGCGGGGGGGGITGGPGGDGGGGLIMIVGW